MTALSTAFSSSRILPGQLYFFMRSSAFFERVIFFFPSSRQYLRIKWLIKGNSQRYALKTKGINMVYFVIKLINYWWIAKYRGEWYSPQGSLKDFFKLQQILAWNRDLFIKALYNQPMIIELSGKCFNVVCIYNARTMTANKICIWF